MSPLREDMPPDAFRQWLRRSLKDRAHFIADQVRNGDVPPLEQAAIRGIPTQAAVGFRAEYKLDEALARQDAFPGAEASTALTRRELDRARMVQDALDYRWARLAGVPAVKLIARRRGISEASAKQRIFRARQEGVLQPDPGFDLTSEGQQLRYELHYRLTGTRILGEA